MHQSYEKQSTWAPVSEKLSNASLNEKNTIDLDLKLE